MNPDQLRQIDTLRRADHLPEQDPAFHAELEQWTRLGYGHPTVAMPRRPVEAVTTSRQDPPS